ncbi:MAG TPA: glycogen-binding domain-containing protein [Spirochaetota bacterium]|nr:glycogen-binding domain-containing protein [Spirochaetota bacterium]
MYIKKFIYIYIFTLIFSYGYSIEKYVDIDLVKKAQPPRFLDKGILFTLKEDFGNSIYIRTNIDGWLKSWYFKKNLYGVWCLLLPYDRSKDEFLYKLNVNGFWEIDPDNSEYVEDKYGSPISILKLPKEVYYHQQNPIIESYGDIVKKIKFKYYNPKAKEVNIVTSLDNWSQFANSMVLNDDGYWEISLNFKKGKYFYYYLVDGKKIVDFDNPNKNWIPDIKEVSVVYVD